MNHTIESLRRLPSLTQATAAIYAGGFVLLAVAAALWVPEMSPRWMIIAAAGLALAKALYSVARGSRLTVLEAVVMALATMIVTATMTWFTGSDLAALANGVTLPVLVLYVMWFVPPVTARVLLYGGSLGWLLAVVHRGDPLLIGCALAVLTQLTIGVEVFGRIRSGAERLAGNDSLTGVANRGRANEVAVRCLDRLVDRGAPFSIILLDLDGLRTINNVQGHRAGDEMLVEACRHWQRSLRSTDLLARIGGDEFLIVLPNTSAPEAFAIKRRLREGAIVQWSAGVAQARLEDSFATLMHRADTRMYRQKAERAAAG